MKDKIAVVTGPTSGIGKQIATELAARGAHVVLACRDTSKGDTTLAEISRKTGSDKLSVLQVDTSSQKSIKAFAARMRTAHDRLDVLVNNAGINARTRKTNEEGIELTFATNVIGYHAVTRELLDLLKAGAPSRIVNVASTFAGNLDLDDLPFEKRTYDAVKAYQQSKACDRLWTWALARRLEGTRVVTNAMAPGLVQTGLYRDTPAPIRLMLRIVGLFHGRSVEQGADTAVWLASSPEVEGLSGKLFELRKEVPCQFRNRDDEERLWKILESGSAILQDHA
jgi:NAD(P)-dependent dehydrogenase (short-subunit alcohol dehydrogenase family)